MVKILSPISRTDEVEEVIQAGADELYCGILTPEWRERYTVVASPNRREEDNPIINTSPHFQTFSDLKEAVRMAHSFTVPVHLTLNEHYFTLKQYSLLFDYIERSLDAGVDAFILSDIAFLLSLKERYPDVKVHIGTGGTTFNSETAKFYQDLGVKRIIFPRHLEVREIRVIVENTPGMEFETFILNSRCANVDGFCTFQHGLADFIPEKDRKRPYENACMLPYQISMNIEDMGEIESEAHIREKISWERQHIWSGLHIDDRPCGACALYEFEEIGIYGVKIVGRENLKSKKVKDTRFLRTLIGLLGDKSVDKLAFREKARQLYRDTYQWPCIIFKCYYPSVLMEDS
jgi:collagenase-like PrtC family protease